MAATAAVRRAGTLALLVLGAVGGALVTLWRLPVSARDTLYAEDGRVFLQDWLVHPKPGLLLEPYDGYQHFLPRALSALVSLLPIQIWPLAVILAGGALVGLVGVLSALAARNLVRSRVLLVALAAVPVLLPVAGIEPIGNMANLHWFMFYLAFWVSTADPRRISSAAGWGVVMFVASLTEIQLLLLAPLVLVQALRKRGAYPLVALGWMLGLATQGVTYLTQGRGHGEGAASVGAAARGYLVNVVVGSLHGNQARVSWMLELTGWWFPTIIFLAFVAVVAWMGTRVPDLAPWTIAALIISIVAWGFSFFLNNYPGLTYSDAPFPLIRWATGASLLLWSAVLLVLEMVRRAEMGRRFVMAQLVGSLALILAASFPATVDRRADTIAWSVAISEAGPACEGSVPIVEVGIAPEQWTMLVPCSRLTGSD